MLDHVFTDAIGALRDSLERAFLERQAFEERFQVDVLLGDVTWETSYGLPGEGLPPRVPADLQEREFAIEVSYEGSYDLDEATLEDGTILDNHLSAMGGWIAATLVRLGDLTLPFL